MSKTFTKKLDKSAPAQIAAPAVVVAEPVAPVTAAKRTIQKERATQNGVTRPSAGGKCAAIWDFYDAHPDADVKAVKAFAAENGYNANNATIEYYRARKFAGVRGRISKPAPAPVTPATN